MKLEKDVSTAELDIIKELGESGNVELDNPEEDEAEDPVKGNLHVAQEQLSSTPGKYFFHVVI